MKHFHDLIHSVEERVALAGHYLSNTLNEYDRGVKNSPDVLSASQRLISFRRRLTELRRNYQIAKVDVLSLSGEANELSLHP